MTTYLTSITTAALSSTDLQALGPEVFSGLDTSDIGALSSSVLMNLSVEQLKAITPTMMPLISEGALAGLSGAFVGELRCLST